MTFPGPGESEGQYNLTEYINRQTRISDAVFMAVLICVGVFGNTLIIASVIVTKKLRDTTNVFVCNVAVSDLIAAGYVLPLGLGNIIKQDSVLDQASCVFTACVMLISSGVSLFSFAMIAFNRYICICHHGKYGRIFTTGKLVMMVAIVWIFIILIVVIGALPGLDVYFYNPDHLFCSLNTRLSPPYTFVLISVGVAIPTVTTGAFYLFIYRKMKTTARNIANNSSAKTVRDQKNNRAIFTMFIAFLVYVVLWFPSGVVFLLEIFLPVHPLVGRIAVWLAAISFCVDWIVYGVLNSNFRDAYRNIWSQLKGTGKKNDSYCVNIVRQ